MQTAVLLKVVLDGLQLFHPGGAVTGGDVEQALQLGSPQQRARIHDALREIHQTVNQIQGGS